MSLKIVRGLLSLTFVWALINAVYVYLVLGGDRLFRLESATYILAAVAVLSIAAFPGRPPVASDVSRGLARAVGLVAIAVWLLLFIPLARYPLLSEDYGFRVLYSDSAALLRSPQFFRPAFATAFFVADALGGRQSPIPLHLVAFALHLIAAACTAILASRLSSGRRAVAVLAFVLALLNPIQLEAVLWGSGLQELLWSAAMLGALVCYTRRPVLTAGDLAATALLVLVALLSKETAVAFVVLLPLTDVFFFGTDRLKPVPTGVRVNHGRLLPIAYAVFAGEAVLYLVARSQLVTVESTFLVAPSRFFFKQLVSIPYKTFAQPWNADAAALSPVVLFAAAVLALAVLYLVVVSGRADRRLLFGPALILASTLPVYSYFFVDANLMSSRYIYFAASGWAILAADCLGRLLPTTRAWLVAALLLAAASAASLQVNLRPWRTVAALVEDMAARLARGEPDAAVLASAQTTLGPALKIDRELPDSYQGVQVFRNGFPEFAAASRPSTR